MFPGWVTQYIFLGYPVVTAIHPKYVLVYVCM